MDKRRPIIRAVLSRLQHALASKPASQAGLRSITLALPELQLSRLPQLDGDWFYWGKPSDSYYLLGLGEATRLTAEGEQRLPRLAARFEALRQDWEHLDPQETGFRATTFCGFAFEADDPMNQHWQGLPNAAIFVPELLLHQRGHRCALTFSFSHNTYQRATLRAQHLLQKLLDTLPQDSGPQTRRTTLARTSATPSDADWIEQINQATSLIRRGGLDKVVPFRRISVTAQHPFNPSRLIASLDDLYPSSLLFSIHRQGCTFVSATPEKLISLNGRHLYCDAVGGTIKRSHSPQTDHRLGQQLLDDPKSRHEHALVVKGILASLESHCSRLHAPDRPSLKRLRNLQHLWTGISGQLRDHASLLQIADDLHPTAAVSGFPSATAGRWLSEHQNTRRGWYTGAAGWLDREGDGELAVLLRCALLNGDHAELFAGAGVTSESCPTAELQETELKFGTMLEALEHA